MANHRKTLEQKKIADLRHKFYSLDQTRLSSNSKSFPSVRTNLFSQSKNVATTASLTNKYPYLLHDILKTGVLTGLILIVQIILFFLLKNKIIVLPAVGY